MWCPVWAPGSPHLLQGGEDLLDEPVCEQEVQQPVQGHHRSRLPDQGGDGGRPAGHHAGGERPPAEVNLSCFKRGLRLSRQRSLGMGDRTIRSERMNTEG